MSSPIDYDRPLKATEVKTGWYELPFGGNNRSVLHYFRKGELQSICNRVRLDDQRLELLGPQGYIEAKEAMANNDDDWRWPDNYCKWCRIGVEKE